MRRQPICGEHPALGEFTLCGDSYDAHETGDSDRPIIIAKVGQTITCPECRAVIIEMRRYKKDFKQP